MLVARIRGGLGNQFFCYAFLYAKCRDNGVSGLVDDYIYETSYKLREFKLDDYCITFGKHFMKRRFRSNALYPYFCKVANGLKRKFGVFKNICEKEEFLFQEIDIHPQKNYYFNGYWQCYKYFDKYRDELIDEFTLKSIRGNVLELLAKIKTESSCAVHVRRGDYITFKGGKCLSIDYYRNAIQIMNEAHDECKFYFFSDDLEYCKKTFSFLDNTEWVEGEFTDEEELFLMSHCQNVITANSSFSWWGGYLNRNPNSMIICPVVDMWTKDFYPDNWVKIDAALGD